MIEQFYAKSHAFKVTLGLSLALHAAILIISGLEPSEKWVDLGSYRAVKLMDVEAEEIEIPAEPEPVPAGEIKPQKKEIKTTFRKERVNFNSYLPFFKVARLPEFKSRVTPIYPEAAKMAGTEAEVLAEVYIDEDGEVRKVRILKSGGAAFDRAVEEALRRSSFSPAVSRTGELVAVKVRIPFKFELD